MKHAFTLIRDVSEPDGFWLGELSADRKLVRCVIDWDGNVDHPHWFPQEKAKNEITVAEGHRDYGWCCAKLALSALSQGVTK